MQKIKKGRTVLKYIGMTIVILALASGCSYLSGSSGSPSSSKSAQKQGPTPSYYDFGDVLIPSELKVDLDESFVYKTNEFSAGVMKLSARVERNSLIAFFENNMAKDHWELISSFKSPRTMMLFYKENRWCVISITDRKLDYNTHVEIWVAPTGSNAGIGVMDSSGLLK